MIDKEGRYTDIDGKLIDEDGRYIDEEGNFIEVGTTEQVVIGDNDQTTWEKADALFSIPEGADSLVVSIRAKKSGPSAFVANHNNLFADELELAFSDI